VPSALDVKNRKLKFAWLCPLLLASTLVQGQELDDTLRKIQRTGSITFGFHPQSFPLSYLDDQKNAVGYTLDLAAQIASAIKQHLKVSKLETKRSTITLQNRFEQVSRGVVDLECNVTTNTTDRQKQFAFSNTFFVATSRLLTRQNSNIKDFADLSGRRALVFGNTTTEHLLRKFSSEKKPHLKWSSPWT
jgi:ABC-type amino acid transport substrate-binding protein